VKELELDEQLRHPERDSAIEAPCHAGTASAEGETIELPTSGRVREDTMEQAGEVVRHTNAVVGKVTAQH
jgi:hypothetical protein